MTPLQLGAMVSAIANGGTLYYLQHPTTPEEVAGFQPRVKRQLDIAPIVPELSDGMAGAVQYGTARKLRLTLTNLGRLEPARTPNARLEPASTPERGRVVLVVSCRGAPRSAKAAEIAGVVYRNMADHNFFVAGRNCRPMLPP